MRNVSGTTEADGISYPFTVSVPETLDEALDVVPEGEEALLSQFCAKWEQDAKQTPKTPVREKISEAREAGYSTEEIQQAVDAGGSEDDVLQAVVEAVQHAQEYTAEFVLGRRQRSSGITKKSQHALGEAITERLAGGDPEELRKLASEMGLDPEELGI